ncbi:Outer membrane protein assembly factor YaeT precursor [Minicystis rosea]|nr:Outer membrane protein assembly factor YaeT precursor [Minicystis rosea]
MIQPVRLLRALLAIIACAVLTIVTGARAAPPPAETPGAAALLAGEDQGFGTSIPDLGETPAPHLVGKPIRRIELVTVGGRWTTTPAIASVRVGDPATSEAARRILREVLAAGQISRANVEAFAEESGVVLRVNMLPRRLVATIKVNGGALDQGEMLEAAGLTVGGEVTAPQLADVPARIRDHYGKHGFPFAEVRADAADTDQPDKVVVSIDIVPGKPRTVRQRVFVIDPRADREVGDLKKAYRVTAGSRVDEPSLGDADRELGEWLKQHGFFRAEVKHALRHQGEWSWLYVYITPGPRYVPAFDGNRAFDAGDLEQALNLEKSPEHRAGELTDRLRTFYVARGFLDVEVSMVEKGRPEDTVHYLAFTLRENRQVRVTKRVFPCLTGELSPDEVGREIGSFLEEDLPGADTFWPPDPRGVVNLFGPKQGSGGRGAPAELHPLVTYAPETYERALKHLRDLYHSKGYLNAVIGPVSTVRATCSKRSLAGECIPVAPKTPLAARCLTDSLGIPLAEPAVPEEYTCKPDPARGIECSPEMTVRIPIALGPQTTLWDVAFEGNRSLAGAELAKIAELPLGTPISSVGLEAARIRVLDAYRLRGFAYAEVRTNAEPSPDRTRARIRFYVTEREPVVVSGFVVKGATKTNESLILRRVALKTDGPFRQDLARRTEERVATLGTFSSVSVSLEDADVPARRKRVVITVVENSTISLEQRGGFSTGDGVRYTFEFGHRNLGGLAISLTLRIQLSYLFDFLIVDPQVQANYTSKLGTVVKRLERRNTLSVNFPEIGLGPLVSLSLDAVDLRDNQRDYGISKEAIVPTITYRPFRQITAQLGASAEFNDVSIFNDEAQSATINLLRAPQGETVALAQRTSFTADYRDTPLNATRGVLFSTALEHVNAFPVGTIDPSSTKSHFLRFTGRIAGYIRLTPGGTTLALSLSAGYNLQLFNGSKTYPDRLFFLGGVDSLRAFLADSVVPQDVAELILHRRKNAKTGQAWSIDDVALRGGDAAINPRLELRIPVTGVLNLGAFLDTGNLWVDPAQINATLRYALGAGVRVGTPIGPLALDYGINLLRRSWEDFGAFHFSIGLF